MNKMSFLGFEFSPLKLEDQGPLQDFLEQYPQPLTGYTFAALAAWSPSYHYGWTYADPETLLISCILDSDHHHHLLQPLGTFSPSIREKLIQNAADLSYPVKVIGVCDRFLKENPGFIRSFTVREDRAFSNYLYSTSALAKLSGRKYAKKRNLLAQATALYSWTVKPLTAELVQSCFQVLESIMEEEHPQVEGMLERELAALESTLRNFTQLNQKGLLITVDERPVAFSIYEAISPATAAIHFERALRSYKGLYQVINCEAAKVIEAQGFEFINREEDLGDSGLRDAKMSYHPMEIIPAYELMFSNSVECLPERK
jgi:hypothetical protein